MGWEILAVGFGGALGAMSRFGLSGWMQSLRIFQGFPVGILSCNVIGSLLIGLFFGYFEYRLSAGPVYRSMLMIGFLGGFTTFSSFSLDTFHLFQLGQPLVALTNIGVSVLACLLATALGVWFSMTIFG